MTFLKHLSSGSVLPMFLMVFQLETFHLDIAIGFFQKVTAWHGRPSGRRWSCSRLTTSCDFGVFQSNMEYECDKCIFCIDLYIWYRIQMFFYYPNGESAMSPSMSRNDRNLCQGTVRPSTNQDASGRFKVDSSPVENVWTFADGKQQTTRNIQIFIYI